MFQRHFLESFEATGLSKAFELQVENLDGNPGAFGEDSFNEMGKQSLVKTREFLRQNLGRTVVQTGVDFRFYQDFSGEILEAVKTNEIVGIDDVQFPFCGDFIACIATPAIVRLFDWMIEHDHKYSNNEVTLNVGIETLGIKGKTLDDNYWTIGMGNRGSVWSLGDPVNPPQSIKLHHANFTIGAAHKMALLEEVEKYLLNLKEEGKIVP